MYNMIKVTFNGQTKEFPQGMTLKEISEHFSETFNFPIVLAKADNHLMELGKVLRKDCKLEFYDRSSRQGNFTYGRSLQFMLVLAVKRILGKEAKLIIEHSVEKGFYCCIDNKKLTEKTIKEIEEEIKKISLQDLMFTKMNVDRLDAIKYFEQEGQLDKASTFKYISNSYINLYRLDDMYDYFYSELAYSTGQIDDFKLTLIDQNGFVVNFPSTSHPEYTLDYKHYNVLFNEFREYATWTKTLNITNASDLNLEISKGNNEQMIQLSEAHYNSQISRIADEIALKKKNVKIILIAGPSSSGKTTTSKKLEIYLRSQGISTHQISIDDYFKNRDETPVDKDGNFDFETIKALDLKLFNKDLEKLLKKEKVLLPEFNFIKGIKEYKNKYLQLKDNDIIIIEGLHALNDELTKNIQRESKYKIYISPLTQLNIDNHNRVHSTDIRKLRRITRDNKYRGLGAQETLEMWDKIRKGEEQFIYPYQDNVDCMINSSLLYEIGILKTYVEPLLFLVDEESEFYPEALRLINFLRNFLPMPSDNVPRDSILREFIGGSAYSKSV